MESFTKREIEVVYLLLSGCSNRDISNNLCISEHTTKAHLASIFKKLGVKNRVQATIKCFAMCTRKKLSSQDLVAVLK